MRAKSSKQNRCRCIPRICGTLKSICILVAVINNKLFKSFSLPASSLNAGVANLTHKSGKYPTELLAVDCYDAILFTYDCYEANNSDLLEKLSKSLIIHTSFHQAINWIHTSRSNRAIWFSNPRICIRVMKQSQMRR
jgi:hypothetical protein